MEFRTVGRTGVQVSQLCFGTMSFGGDADEAMSGKLYKRCRDAGINFFDTADMYSAGRSEDILGKLIATERDELVITSKVFSQMGPDVNARGLSRRHIMLAVEDSLCRLNTDRLDFYFCHLVDDLTPMEESIQAMDDLVRQGKILYPAVSNWSGWQTAKALGISAREGLARFECLQPMYSLAKRQVEVEILPLAESEALGVISYSPLGGGLLTGKYRKEQKPHSGRLVDNAMYTKRYEDDMNFKVADNFTTYAKIAGEHPASLAVAWVMANPAITSPIIGARNLEQLEPSLASLDVAMPAERRVEISALSPEPAIATDRSEEK
jgi:aryl-alcohol dehydrogenase-like predicted oxidoreductase